MLVPGLAVSFLRELAVCGRGCLGDAQKNSTFGRQADILQAQALRPVQLTPLENLGQQVAVDLTKEAGQDRGQGRGPWIDSVESW